MQEEAVKGIPLLAKNHVETQTDTEVKLPKPIAVKAGEELGLMGEYNQTDEQDKKLLHLEVFTYDNIDAFRTKAKTAYEEDKKREKGKRVLQDNFLYVNRNSPSYAIAENQVTPLGTTSTEVMVPLSEVEKKTVKEGEKSRNYYNIQPYLHHGTKSKTGIYVDDSHVTHGITFPGINVFGQKSNSLCLFDAALHDYLNPNSGLTIEEKNKLDPLFKAIMDELDLDTDKGAPIQFEAGRLRDILLDPIQQRRLTGIIVKHDNEWKTTRQLDFEPVCNVYRENGKEEKAARLAKRVEDLSIGLKVEQFDTEQQAYFIHPLGVIGLLSRKNTYVTLEQLNILFPSADINKKQEMADVYNEYCEQFNMHTPKIIAHFFAQIMEEVGQNISYKNESLNYSSEHLKRPKTIIVNGKKLPKGPFRYFIQNPTEADKYGRNSQHAADQRAIANLAYANRNGNGDVASNDGWNFRGKGFIQLTGRGNYNESQKEIEKYAPSSGIDIINNPESILTIKGAMLSSMGYWTSHGLNSIAEKGCSDADVNNVTNIVNYYTDSKAERRHNFSITKKVWKCEE
ncbi:glycoside hydrolase family 19 protein [Exercitatus varius]|nr:hypothetical protein [Exercitatus varius]MDG2942356.1 hypothetical protein [Exercitatus varius]